MQIELNVCGDLIHHIRLDGRRAWIFRNTGPTTGKRERIYLGSNPLLSLETAREMRQAP